MKKTIYLLLILLLASCGSDNTSRLSSDNTSAPVSAASKAVESVFSTMENGAYKEGELLVKFKSGTRTASSLKVHQDVGATSMRKFSIVPSLEHVKLPEGASVKDAIKQYMSDPNVEYAEPNFLKRAALTPNDTYFGQQWGMTKISSPSAWGITTGSTNVVVAVLDTGIDFTHPDFVHPGGTSNISSNGSDFTHCLKSDDTCATCLITKSPTSNPMDNNGHGAHVSGIIGAVGNNSIGVAGLNWNVQVMPLKMLDSTGCGTTSDEIAAIDYAIQAKNGGANIRAMNASFAGSDFSNAEFDAVNSANSAGILLMAAAGNEGTSNDSTPSYPASFSLPNVIAVAATSQSDNLASFSNYGQNSVHVAAPGVNILSTIPLNLPPCSIHPFDANYDYCSGTSQATPHVSGLAALLYSVYPNFTHSQIRGMIIKYVDVLPSLQNKILSGGRINAYKSASALLAPTGLSVSVSSSGQASLAWTDNAGGEDGYRIERMASGGSFSPVGTVGANSSSFTDSNPPDGTNCAYRVRAFSSVPNPPGTSIEADSDYSNQATVSIPLAAPSGLTAISVTSSSVTLTWTNNSQSAQGVKIQRQSPGGSFADVGTVGASAATFTDTGLSSSTTYLYRVAAFNSSGNSGFSNTITVTTPSPGPAPSGGGGGCSIGGRQNTPAALSDLLVILLPIIVLAALKGRRKLRRLLSE